MTSRVALITGSTAGIGLELAVDLCSLGHRVVVNGRSPERVEQAVATVRSRAEGATVLGVPADISESKQVDEMVDRCRRELGAIDMLVHCAVVRDEHATIDTTDESWALVLGVSLDGAFYCTRAVLPDMLERGWGRIVYFGGVSTELGMPGRVGLVVAKNGLYGLTKAVANEVGDRNITVNAVSPGVIEDDPEGMPDDERTSRRRAVVQQASLQRFGTTREVNAAVLFLLSEDGGYVTAQRLSVSGGLVTC